MIATTFDQIISTHKGLIQKYTYNIIKMYNMPIDEANQIALIAAWMSWETQKKIFENQTKEWAFGTILHKNILVLLKKYRRSRHKRISGIPKIFQHEDISLSKSQLIDDNEFVHKYIGYLPSQEKEIIKLRFLDDLTLQECANKTNLSLERIRNIEHSGIKRLKLYVQRICEKNRSYGNESD